VQAVQGQNCAGHTQAVRWPYLLGPIGPEEARSYSSLAMPNLLSEEREFAEGISVRNFLFSAAVNSVESP